MVAPLRVACIGAGARAAAAHLPCIRRLAHEGLVEIVGLAELSDERRALGGQMLGLAATRHYARADAMLAAEQPALVYAIMGPGAVRPVAEQVLGAGAHLVLEKPPGATLNDVAHLTAMAATTDRLSMVTFQRRWAAVTVETRRRLAERGATTMCLLEFHKDLLNQPAPAWGVSTLWEDIVHVVDLARYLCGGEAVAVHRFRDARGVDWPNLYNALVRFDTGATAIITGNRSSGGRYLRVEGHALGIGAYLDDFPARVRFLTDNRADETLSGAQLVASETVTDWDGLMAMHRDMLDCVRANRQPMTHLGDALATMQLVDRIEHGDDRQIQGAT